MMQEIRGIYFVTSRTDHEALIYNNEKITVLRDLELFERFLDENKAWGYDIETNGSRLYICTLLLAAFGTGKAQFVLDATCGALFDKAKELINARPDRTYIGHNIKFDYEHSKTHGIYFERIFDTMVAEQRIDLGKETMTANLEDVYRRRLGRIMDTDKNIRLTFLKMNIKSRFNYRQILYSAKDTDGLIDIARVQRATLQSYGSFNWFNGVENGLTPILGDMELEGVQLNEEYWYKNINKKKGEKLETERKLDEELRKVGGFKIKPRNRTEIIQTNLFGAPTEKENQNIKHINYNSSKQVLKTIGKLGFIPPLYKEKGKKPVPSVREDAVKQYMIENPGISIMDFLENLIKYKELSKFIGSYGSKFLNYEVRKKTGMELGYKNPITNLVHTYFKQCETETGRLASGRAKEGYFNSQQIPAEKELRECFTLTQREIDEGWFITTCDLSGAELIIMAALAGDTHLYELGADKWIDGKKVEGDLHSPIITKCWRAVYQYRLAKFKANFGEQTLVTGDQTKLDKYFTIKDSKNKAYILTHDFVVSKSNNKQLRTDAKANTFGAIYGMHDAKCAQTLNIPKDEAGVILKVIHNEFPKTFKMVEEAAMCALMDGYVIFNNRSNNRRWFSPVVRLIEEFAPANRAIAYQLAKQELPFGVISEIEGAARNCRIQGTQADMIKESQVAIKNFSIEKNIRQFVKPILNVHDELVVKHKGFEFGADVARIMQSTANLYLSNYSSDIKMGCEYHTGKTWTK